MATCHNEHEDGAQLQQNHAHTLQIESVPYLIEYICYNYDKPTWTLAAAAAEW